MLSVLLIGYGISMATSVQQQKNWGTPYHIIFNRIEGIEEGSTVTYNGSVVGRVRKLELRTIGHYPRADVTISISPLATNSVVLTDKSSYTVEGGFAWGMKWINIEYREGKPVPAGGQVDGETVTSFTSILQHGIIGINQLYEMLAYYKGQLGSGEKAREKIKAMIKYWNYMGFDLRVQANKFNKFAGLINQRMDKTSDQIRRRITGFYEKERLTVEEMRLWARAMTVSTVSRQASMHAKVDQLLTQLHGMQGMVSNMAVFLNDGDKIVHDLLDTARKRVQGAEEMVATLRFISKNPKLAEQFRVMTGDMSKRTRQLRSMVEDFRKRLLPTAAPTTAPTPTHTATPGESVPLAPGIPSPPAPSPTPTSF